MTWKQIRDDLSSWPHIDWLKMRGVSDPIVTFFVRITETSAWAQSLGLKLDAATDFAEKKALIQQACAILFDGLEAHRFYLTAADKKLFRIGVAWWFLEDGYLPRLMLHAAFSRRAALAGDFEIDYLCCLTPEHAADCSAVLPCGSTSGAALAGPDEGQSASFGVVIDDGLPILHRNFLGQSGQTRFAAAWLQDLPLGGAVYSKQQIETLRQQLDEAAAYRQLNGFDGAGQPYASTNRPVTHGAAVADLAFGTDPLDISESDEIQKIRDLALLAVQLPASVIADSSGQVAPAYILGGITWAMSTAMETAAQDGHVLKDLFLNLSVGSLAGPDQKSYFADWLDYLVALYNSGLSACGDVACKPRRLFVSAAYGNAYRDNLVARGSIAKCAPMDLGWQVLPEDFSSSVLEIRSSDLESLSLQITPPGDVPQTLRFADLGTSFVLETPQGVCAMVTFFDQGSDQGISVVVSGTADFGGTTATAAAGCWGVSLHTDGAAPSDVVLKVRRDDTPTGHRLVGRQSYLTHNSALVWDDVTKDFSKPGANSPISRLGTHVNYAGAEAEGIYFVGARQSDGGDGEMRPAPYSSAGMRDPSLPGALSEPSCSVIVDPFPNRRGLPSAGVLSRGRVRLSGTSAAAAIVTRHLVLNGPIAAGQSAPQMGRVAL